MKGITKISRDADEKMLQKKLDQQQQQQQQHQQQHQQPQQKKSKKLSTSDLSTSKGVVEFQFNSVLQLHGVTKEMLDNSEYDIF